MKNRLFFSLATVWAILLFVFSSCSEKEIVLPPEIKVESAVKAEQAGGEISIPISIENLPSEDPDAAKLSVKSSENWVHDFIISPDKVVFTVDPNDSKAGSEPRTAKLSFSYPGASKAEVVLTQDALAELVLSLEIMSSTSSEYSVKCTPDDQESTYVLRTMSKEEFDALGSDEAVIAADIEAFKRPDWSGNPGSVEKNLKKGETEEFWSFINTKTQVVYAYGLNADETATSKIYKLEVTPLPKPVINFDQPAEVTVEGGRVTVKYSVENPIEGEKIEITQPQVDWIRDITFTDTEITFTVDPNTDAAPGSDPRKGFFNVSYKDAYNKAVVVTQAAPEEIAELGLTLSLESLSSSEVKVKCTPDDFDRTYVLRMMSKTDFDSYGSDEAVIAADIETFLEPDPWFGTPGTIEANLNKGLKVESWSFYNDKSQVVYAYGLNADGTATSRIYKLEVTPPAKPVIKAETPLNVPSEGGTFKVKYTIENPVEGKVLTATPSYYCDTWVKVLDVSATEITVSVSPYSASPGAASRSGDVTLNYPDAYGSFFTIVQASPELSSKFDIKLDILDVTANSVKVRCTPSDQSATYVVRSDQKDNYDLYPSENDVVKADIQYFTEYDWSTGKRGTIEENLKTGTQEVTLDIYGTYIWYVYTYGLEADGTRTTSITKVEIDPTFVR